ncbi:MAG: hypothetical protein JWP91_3354 [Fibrobacteres bacterium]|nr:hypothetical protein [Fibrobacterota bacterium]
MDSALSRLPSLLARQRRLRAAAGSVRILWALIGIHLIGLSILGWVSLRYPLSPACLVVMAWSYCIYLLLPIAYWFRWTARANGSLAVARELDHANPTAPDPFRTVLSLENHDAETLGHLERLYSGFLPRLKLPRPIWFPRPHRVAIAAGLLTLAVSAFLTGRPGEFLRRATLPWLALDRLPTLRFELGGSPSVLGAGDTARVAGLARNLIPGQAVYAYVRTASGESRFPLTMTPDQKFEFAFGPATSDFSMYFAGDNGRSPILRFRVLAAPFLARIQAVLEPPAYTRLRTDTLPHGVVRFPVLPGTRVTWLLESDRELKRLGWSFRPVDTARDSGAAKVTDASRGSEDTLGPGRSFRVAREIRKAQDYAYWLEDDQGIRSRASLPSRVDLIPDLAPEVDLVAPGNDTVLDRDARLPIAFRVKDDFGVTSLKLVYRVLADGKVRSEGQRDSKDWLKQARAGLVEAEWDLGPLHLRPDNVVEFHLAAVDNDTVNGPKTGRSATRALRMPSVQEVLAASRQKEQSAVANIKSALQREKQLERKLEREKQAPREEGPPMIADYEINRIMVDDPRDHQRRAEATLSQLSQSMDRQSKEDAGKDRPGEKAADKAAKARDMSQAQSAAREMQEFLKKNEAALPRGNQGMLPVDERRKNLENLIKSQKEQAAKLANLKEKLEKPAAGKPQMDLARMQLESLSKDLERNIQNQADLEKLLQDQAAQAKAKSDMMDQAIQEQMRMAEDMKGANDDLKKAMDQGAKNGLLSPELMEKMKKVQELLREVLPDSLQKMMESKLQGQEVNEQELKEKLKEMLEKQAELAENLNRALAMLEQLKDRKRMQELKSVLGELQAREQALEKQLQSGQAGSSQDAEQKAIQQEAQKALTDFSAQAAGKKELQEMEKRLKPGPVQKDMQDVRQSLAAASKGKSRQEQSAATASASKSASSAAAKLGEMGEMLGEAMAGMESSVDLAEAQELLQESLALSRLQILIRSGAARRQAEGWESDEAALYGSVAQTAQWLNERVKALAAKVPFMGQALTAESRNLAAASREAASQYAWEISEKSLRHNQNLSRELLKLLKMAQNSGQGSGSGSGSGSPGASGQGQGQGQGGGDLSGQLQGMSGKQMAINQATFQLLKAMMEGRQPGPGGKGKQGGKGGEQGEGSDGQSGEGGPGGRQGQGGQGSEGGEGSLGGMANKQGELGESLESLAEGLGEEGGSAQKIRSLADEARRLEEELRGGRLTPEELKRRQERFQSRLLEASNAMQERGQSESRQAETSRGGSAEVSGPSKAAEEARLLQLLREARRNAKGLRLSEGQRKYLEEYYESLLTR